MKILDHEQQSPEWHAARCGVPTSSNFDKIVMVKGEPSKQKEKYLYRLAGECITGKAEETYQNAAMQRGIEMEGEARKLYVVLTEEIVVEVGLCLAEGHSVYGASPDGLVGKDGMIEIKCPNMATHVGYLLKGTLPTEYFQQLQGQLLVTGRKWVDFMSYYPGMKPFIVRVERDVNFLTVLRIGLEGFCVELEDIVKKIR